MIYRRPEGKHFYAYAQLRSTEAASDDTLVGDIKVFDFSGNLIAEILGVRLWFSGLLPKTGVCSNRWKTGCTSPAG